MRRILVLCRHTQTDYNAQNRYTGQQDPELNNLGKNQAARLAHDVSKLPGLCGILSSDLKRTRYLANLIGKKTGLEPIFLPELREVALGRLEGLTKDEAKHRFPAWHYQTANPSFDFRSAGGEWATEVRARYIRALRQAAQMFTNATGPEARVVVVGHGTALRLLFQYQFGAIGALHSQGAYQQVAWPNAL